VKKVSFLGDDQNFNDTMANRVITRGGDSSSYSGGGAMGIFHVDFGTNYWGLGFRAW
jgi:hypothetical protein